MSEKFRDNIQGICADCREPVLKSESLKYEYRAHWVVIHWPKCPKVNKSVRMVQ